MKNKQVIRLQYSGFFLLELLVGLFLSLLVVHMGWWLIGSSYDYLMRARAFQQGLCCASNQIECRAFHCTQQQEIAAVKNSSGYVVTDGAANIVCGDVPIHLVVTVARSGAARVPTIILMAAERAT